MELTELHGIQTAPPYICMHKHIIHYNIVVLQYCTCTVIHYLHNYGYNIILCIHTDSGVGSQIYQRRNVQFRIFHAFHADKTSCHLGYRKTLASITERFAWKGVSKDAKEIVSYKIMLFYINALGLRTQLSNMYAAIQLGECTYVCQL